MRRLALALGLGLALAGSAAEAAQGGFQAACERLVVDRPIAIVAVDARTGMLRALVHPGLAAEPHPPGSVFKLVTAAAAIEAGIAPPSAAFACKGWFRPPGLKGKALSCWKPTGHGKLVLEEAIAQSCNVTFYQLGWHLGPPTLLDTAAHCGLGAAPGWRRLPNGPRDSAGLGIGEGPGVGVTALQLAGFVAALATGGPLIEPAWKPKPAHGPAMLGAATASRLRAGMRAAVVHGSARLATVAGLAVAGKTGTATYLDGSNRTYGWFVGFAPAERPRVAIAVFQREGTGFSDAAALGRRVFEAWVAAGRP